MRGEAAPEANVDEDVSCLEDTDTIDPEEYLSTMGVPGMKKLVAKTGSYYNRLSHP